MSRKKAIVSSIVVFLLGVASGLTIFRGQSDLRAAAAGGTPEIILYSEPDFQGRELHLYKDAVDLPFDQLGDAILPWNDSVGSIVVVSGTWRLYQHGRLNTEIDDTALEALDVRQKAAATGWSSALSATSRGPLRIASPEHAGIGHDISSVQLVSSENLPDWLYEER
jgi:hypothetical protein